MACCRREVIIKLLRIDRQGIYDGIWSSKQDFGATENNDVAIAW